MKFSILLRVLLVSLLLSITVDRLPAPISEVETPTPTPARPSQLKSKGTVKHETGSENSGTATTPKSSPPKTRASSSRSAFAGTWFGVRKEQKGDTTLIINAAVTVVAERSGYGTFSWAAMCDGVTVRWRTPVECDWTF